jgi:CBS-domain-containing membrane protein
MTNEEIRRLPVVDKAGRLVGIVCIGDVRSAEPSPATSLSVWELNYLLSSLDHRQDHDPQPLDDPAPEATTRPRRRG